jgi:hypothetical protein
MRKNTVMSLCIALTLGCSQDGGDDSVDASCTDYKWVETIELDGGKPGDAAVSSLSDSGISETEGLRFDGLYLSKRKGDKTTYILSFYEDGVVVGFGTTGSLEKVAELANRKQLPRYSSKGHWMVSGDRIAFTLTAEYGLGLGPSIVDYGGRIQSNLLLLDTYSHATDNRCCKKKYCFFPCTLSGDITCQGISDSCLSDHVCTLDR